MRLTNIGYARTYSRDYQTYRASAEAELEEWETDIDASYVKLREIVRAQIGKQCEDYNGADSDKVLVLKEAINKLESDRNFCYDKIKDLNYRIQLLTTQRDKLESGLEKGLNLLNLMIQILKQFSENDSENVLEVLRQLFDLRNNVSFYLNPEERKDDDENKDDKSYL